MPNVHTIWESSTLGEGKKLGSSPNNRYSTNTRKLHDSTTEKLDKVVNCALYLADKYEKIKDDFCLLKRQYYNIYNENVRLKGEIRQLLADTKNVTKLERQTAFDKQHIESLTTELERLKSQYLDIHSTISQVEANSIASEKEIDVLKSRLKELESILSTKMMEIHTLEAELSSKSFELQTVKTECGVFKQHISDMAEQSSIKKYHTQSSVPEKQKETLGGGIIGYSFLYSTSLKRNTLIIFSLLLLLIFWICRHKIGLLIRNMYLDKNSYSFDTKNHVQRNIPLTERDAHIPLRLKNQKRNRFIHSVSRAQNLTNIYVFIMTFILFRRRESRYSDHRINDNHNVTQ